MSTGFHRRWLISPVIVQYVSIVLGGVRSINSIALASGSSKLVWNCFTTVSFFGTGLVFEQAKAPSQHNMRIVHGHGREP